MFVNDFEIIVPGITIVSPVGTASGEPDTKTKTAKLPKFSEKERLFQSGANLCWAIALPHIL